ncbi:MAG: formate--tetrahydrofolate ligase [Bacilli bacterium]
MNTDLEIAKSVDMEDINHIAKKIGIDEKYIECYGKYKAKISLDIFKEIKNRENGKLILVTSTNPTPYGEGKTTTSIGINDALNKIGKKSLVVLREPSLGPVFGIKGGATGGGYSQVVPMEDINLHFTGDIHAIGACNNLLCAIIDNHIFQGNNLNIDIKTINFNRCLDINDRALRNCLVAFNNKDGIEREEKFNITVASEIMAILCLANDIDDLKKRLGNIFIAYNTDGNPIYARDLHCEGALTLLLKDAIKPNLVQTLEHNPAIIHGGPFANIAHGCNSLIATKLGLKLSDYVVTEAGFGSDLGAEKFLDIKCRIGNLKPNLIVINTTLRSLKYNGNQDIKDELELLKSGICNLEVHIDNMRKYSKNILVCLNKFTNDTEEEISYINEYCNRHDIPFAISDTWKLGGAGGIELANKIVDLTGRENNFKLLYNNHDHLIDKIKKVCHEIYRADDINVSDAIMAKIEKLEKNGYRDLPVCIAKTQYSLSDNPKLLGKPQNFNITIRDIKLCSGAGFIVVLAGNIMTMPGLSKAPAYLNMDIDNNGNIYGLF